MFSFLNGKSPFDEAEEKLEAGETVNGRPKMPSGPVMGWQDGLFLLVIIGLIVGGYQYYQHSKTESTETFARCNALFDEAATNPEKYLDAEACFDSTWDLGFVSDTMEVLRQNRMGEILDKRNAQKDMLEDAKDALSQKDTAKAVEIVRGYQGAMFLRNYDKEDWEKIAKLEVAAPGDSNASAADTSAAEAKAQ